MTRAYTLKRRADKQADTRLRIVEAAVDLHSSVGPARTSLSMVAERAGVQRQTLYAHFPDERSLLMACSALTMERDGLPDPTAWRSIEQPDDRLRAALDALYAWYERNADLAGCVLRDAECHAPTREISDLRFGPVFAAYHEVLGADRAAAQSAMLHLALAYSTWRSLVRASGLSHDDAVEAMVRAVRFATPRQASDRL